MRTVNSDKKHVVNISEFPDHIIDVKKYLNQFKANLTFLIIALVLFLFTAFLYLRYTTPQYKIHAKVLVQDEKKNASSGSFLGSGMIKDFGDLFGIKNNVANEVEILETKALLSKIVKEHNYFVQYFRTGLLNDIEQYKSMPFEVVFTSPIDSIIPLNITLLISKGDSLFQLNNEKSEPHKWFRFGDIINAGNISFYLKKSGLPYDQREYSFTIKNIDQTVSEIASKLSIDVTNKETTVIGIDYVTTIPRKGEDLLANLIGAYMDRNLNEKNRIIDSTLIFLTQRINIVINDLNGIESEIQTFKEKNGIIDIPNQSKSLIENANNYYNKSKEAEVQLEIVGDMLSTLESGNKTIMPYLSNSQPSFLALLQSYNSLIIDRDKSLLTARGDNPILRNIEVQLATVRSDMIRNLKSQQKDLSTAKVNFDAENKKVIKEIASLPLTERTYINYSRERDVKQALYLFLLQQKEQAAISKASNISNATIIDGPKSEYRPFTPKRIMIYLIGVFAAIFLTLLWIFVKGLFNNKIVSKKDLLQLTDCPIIAEIGHNINDSIILDDDGRSVLSEQFRQLRTNLSFTIGNNKCSRIVVTSSISGEGKSFISFNLALIYARTGKKVLLIEMDLRKPKLSRLLNMDNTNGYTNYIVNNGDINKYIQQLPINEHLYFLSSGPVPPNPAEILMSESTESMFGILSQRFDYIIIDTPPLGLVTDAQIISKFSDTVLYLVRCNFSYLKSIETINEHYLEKKLNNLYLVMNDMKSSNGGYGYGYGYGYTYGYGYGIDDERTKEPFFKRILKKLTNKKKI